MRRFVRKLTLLCGARQSFDVYAAHDAKPNPGLLLVAALVMLLAIGSDVFAAQAWQPTADIIAAAENFLQQRTQRGADRTSVKAAALDPRHRLPLCDAELEVFLRPGAEIGPRTIVGVRCTGARQWQVYVPVYVIVRKQVLTARRTLPRGHLMTADDVAVDERDVSRMLSGYFSDPQALAGQRLKQQLLAGQVITPGVLAADRIVRRGQTVTIVAAGAGVNISMRGKALMDGALNQRIRVENLNSGRVVEGIVRSPEHVEVLVSAERGFFHAKPKVSRDSADTQASNNDR